MKDALNVSPLWSNICLIVTVDVECYMKVSRMTTEISPTSNKITYPMVLVVAFETHVKRRPQNLPLPKCCVIGSNVMARNQLSSTPFTGVDLMLQLELLLKQLYLLCVCLCSSKIKHINDECNEKLIVYFT